MLDRIEEIRLNLVAARRERDAVDEGARAAAADLAATDRALARLTRAGAQDSEEMAALRAHRARQEAARDERNRILAQATRRARGLYAELVELVDTPQRGVARLFSGYPFLLLPVRLETKFMQVGTGRQLRHELWVRIYPDAIAVEGHEPALTEAEAEAGRAYWEAEWRASGEEAARRQAWARLVDAFDANRAAWVARVLTPLNQDQRPTAPPPADQPLDPAPAFRDVQLRESGWTAPPRSRVLPERFVIMTFVSGEKVHEEVGRAVPEPLPLGPDPRAPGLGFARDGVNLTLAPELRWMVDFDEAERVGMGVRIPLTPEQAARGFDRVLALGVRLADDHLEASQRLEELLESRHYTDGLSIVTQGAPTNNTPGMPSGYDRRALERDPDLSFPVERGAPLFAVHPDAPLRPNGQRLAEALGVRYRVFEHVRHSDGIEQDEARAMNTALWPTTLGYFMEEMMAPVFDRQTIRQTRRFLIDYVSGRGPVPVLRVGRQPYGIMLTSVFSRLDWAAETDDEEGFLGKLYGVLRKADETWTALSLQVANAGATADPEGTLLNMLGLHPTSVEFAQRHTVGPNYRTNWLLFAGHTLQAREAERRVKERAEQLLRELGFDFAQTPRLFELTFFGSSTRLDGPVVDDRPLSETQPLRELVPGIGNYIQWLLRSDLATINREDFGNDADGKPRPAPLALLYLLLRHALTLAYAETGGVVVRENRLPLRQPPIPGLAERPPELELRNLGATPQLTRWHALALLVPRNEGTVSVGELLRARRLIPALADLIAARELDEVEDALALLAERPTAALERLLAEHLDLCSYRLDAWQIGLLHRRLERYVGAMRAEGDAEGRQSGETAGRGIYLGAYGWLEDVSPAAARRPVLGRELPAALADGGPVSRALDNAGYVHAPSLTHAAAAAILREAHLTHGSEAAMRIDLSSARVRRALWYLDGMRNGQLLGALLGYRFERALHDAERDLDKYLGALRGAFPIAVDPSKPVPPGIAVEAIAARHVLDGQRLLAARPFPYSIAALAGIPAADRQAIEAAVAGIAADVDAVGDLALAEGVYQVAQGNYPRAAAALDGISRGGAIPEPEVVQTPRSGIVVTHRLALLLQPPLPGASAWLAASPRAQAEPWLEQLCARIFGDPGDIRCVLVYRQTEGAAERDAEVAASELGLSALDLLYICGEGRVTPGGELERRLTYVLRRRLGLADEAAVEARFAARQPAWDASVKTLEEFQPLLAAVTRLVTGCRPFDASDLLLPADRPPAGASRPGVDLPEFEARATAALDALDATKQALQAARDAAAAFQPQELDALRNALLRVAAFGLPDAIPLSARQTVETAPQAGATLRRQADGALVAIEVRLKAVPAGPGGDVEEQIEAHTASLRAVFGRDFKALPRFTPHNAGEITQVLAQNLSGPEPALLKDGPPLAVDAWLHGVARVRPRVADLDAVRLMAELFDPGGTAEELLAFTPVQLPFVPGDRWLGLPLAPGAEPNDERLSVVLTLPPGYQPGQPQAGLLIDNWTEIIPRSSETTAVALHFDQPNSEPPQTLLLAIAPNNPRDGDRWSWNDLVDTLHETLALARKRAVEPDMLDETPYAQILPALLTAVTRYRSTIELNLAKNSRVRELLRE